MNTEEQAAFDESLASIEAEAPAAAASETQATETEPTFWEKRDKLHATISAAAEGYGTSYIVRLLVERIGVANLYKLGCDLASPSSGIGEAEARALLDGLASNRPR